MGGVTHGSHRRRRCRVDRRTVATHVATGTGPSAATSTITITIATATSTIATATATATATAATATDTIRPRAILRRQLHEPRVQMRLDRLGPRLLLAPLARIVQ